MGRKQLLDIQGKKMKIIEQYHRKYIICNEFQNENGEYIRRIANDDPNHPDFIEEENLYGKKSKYRFFRQILAEIGKEVK